MRRTEIKETSVLCPEAALAQCDTKFPGKEGDQALQVAGRLVEQLKDCALLNTLKLQCIQDHNKRAK